MADNVKVWQDRRKIAQMITTVENALPGHEEILQDIYKKTGQAYIIGITGPPGAGKSSLTDALSRVYIDMGKRVGVIAIDPTSPFSGGSILGDRIRMNELSTHPQMFIRSMGTRGQLGGLSAATHSAVMVLDACGADILFIETVGVGQSEVEIVKLADTVLMVMVPGLGDDIQTMKAGIMEIGDVFAINKSDLPGADRTKIELEAMLSFLPPKEWRPPVRMVSATEKEGLKELVEAIDEHRTFQEKNKRLEERRKRNVQEALLAILRDKMVARVTSDDRYKRLLEEMVKKEIDPYEAARQLMQK
ncbi:MAG TPA: methylmalonyl Co-A mutase-associated GTPase MeaB [Tissierellia bacterium]|jgi:LAO/AO transport system kinase|nr:methylmalonyl Co-A mutase-associated GTPase MeaB [Tissierellia bacterium]